MLTPWHLSREPPRISAQNLENRLPKLHVCRWQKASEDIASKSTENNRCRQPLFDATSPERPQSAGNPFEYPHKLHYCQKLEFLSYIFLPIVWVYLHSNFRGGLRNTHALCNRLCNGRSRSSNHSNVVYFGADGKGVCDFLLIINQSINYY